MIDENVFDKMENETMTEEKAQMVEKQINERENLAPSGEVDYEKLSEKGIGEKFERILLDGKTITIKKAQLFNADVGRDEPIIALSDSKKQYYKCNFIVHYEGADIPEDKPQREYYSGIIQFLQSDGSLSAHSFYYDGSESQVADLWETVAKKKGIEPKEMSPRVFIGFLNSQPQAIIEVRSFKNPNTGKKTEKNMIKKFI